LEAPQQDVKFVKTKELQKVLVCHIIGIAVHLAQNNRLKAAVLAKTLKKDVNDLKNFFKEIGLTLESFKAADVARDGGKGPAELMIFLHERKARKNDNNLVGEMKTKRAKSEDTGHITYK